ncbi:MAG TPA: 23S rRNA (uracil(1939)-C(5))-methyltransferase RlmD [Thiotrichaceae bacterium]|jgi:23S rRNA (uracil1939-C5)-methyltransferase|nr:23S rRNA (uracil(1939)-C(5))-methyltransferase RlmD [Thiotrichaceae bacterium]HIM07648.1 23S rRNA (uracil(1939)-C(5))-methyltransferase RlmD [Gammaproteobacteria bacterium]
MGRRHRRKIPQGLFTTNIESLSHEARGVAHIDGKTIFVENALAGEQVEFNYVNTRSKYDEGVAENIINASEQRTEPGCEYFGYCGGCSLQHMHADAQLEHKQSVLLEQFTHLGNVNPKEVLPPLKGPLFGYRHKARLGVKYVIKKERVLVGFREKRSPFIADIKHCEVLHPDIGYKISDLQALIETISIKDKIPQIEVAVSDNGIALVMRHLEEFTEDDLSNLKDFEEQHNFKFYLQPGGYDSVHRLASSSNDCELFYKLDDHDINIYFQPTDFTQINVEINKQMINLAIELLEVDKEDNILDLFCGVGNFTLPIARKAKSVVGVEGDEGLVQRAKNNAIKNNIDNVEFYVADLADFDKDYDFMKKPYDKILLDPARTGAKEIISAINMKNIKRIVYVSCNPATLARDAGILVNEKGFKLKKAGVMDMFPHTAHVESIAVFTK